MIHDVSVLEETISSGQPEFDDLLKNNIQLDEGQLADERHSWVSTHTLFIQLNWNILSPAKSLTSFNQKTLRTPFLYNRF